MLGWVNDPPNPTEAPVVSKQSGPSGTTIQVPKGLKGKCDTCEWDGRPCQLITDGTETAKVVETPEGRAAVTLPCPDDGERVWFQL